MAAAQGQVVLAFRRWREATHAYHKDDIHEHYLRKRVRSVIQMRYLGMLSDQVGWAFRQWREMVYLDTKADHERIVRGITQKRIRTALERRLMVSIRDKMIWAFRCWKDFIHMAVIEGHALSVQEMLEAQSIATREQALRRVKCALRRRMMSTRKDQITWAMGQWKQILHLAARDALNRKSVKVIVRRLLVALARDRLALGFRAFVENKLTMDRNEMLATHMCKRVKSVIRSRYMAAAQGQVVLAFRRWREATHAYHKDDIHEHYLRKRVRSVIQMRYLGMLSDQVGWAFRQWREMVCLDTKADHERIVRGITQERIRTALERRLMVSIRDKMIWAFRCWKDFIHMAVI